MLDGVVHEMGEHRRVTLAPLGERHFQRLFDRRRHALDLMRIDAQRAVKFGRGAGELRQDQHAGRLGVLRGDELLGDEVHAVAQRRHQRDVGRPVDAGKRGARIGAVDVAHRRPRRLAESPVNLADQRRDLVVDRDVFADFVDVLGRHQQAMTRPAPNFRFELKEAIVKALRRWMVALGIIEPIDAEDQLLPIQAVDDFVHEAGARRVAGKSTVDRGLDANRKRAELGLVAVERK